MSVPITPGKHRIRAVTADGLAIFRLKVELYEGQNPVIVQLKSQHEEVLKKQQEEALRKQAEAEAALHPTWTDPDTGLMWAKKDNGSDVNWRQANEYCSKLELASYKDWRLPTLEELQAMDDPKASHPAVYDFGAVRVHVKGNLQLTGWSWSSNHYDSGMPWENAMEFDFRTETSAKSSFQHFAYNMRALCVRRAGE